MEIDLKRLQEKFKLKDIEWRVQTTGKKNDGSLWALIVPYLTNRSIQQRLDDVCGAGNWKNEIIPIEKGFICGISIFLNGQWVTKYDGAPMTDIEPIKGGISDSMKRSAVQWGMGRQLYEFPKVYADVSSERKQGYEYQKTKDGVMYWKVPREYATEEEKPMPKPQPKPVDKSALDGKIYELRSFLDLASPESKPHIQRAIEQRNEKAIDDFLTKAKEKKATLEKEQQNGLF